jgi:archaellum component FlaC
MSNEEVNISSDQGGSDDYEVVPIGPIRRLEKRMDNIQEKAQGGGAQANEELIRDIMDIMKSNQKIVNDMTESTHELKNSVEDLTHKMDEVVDNMNSFMDLLKDASEVDMEGEIVGNMQGRIAEAVGDRMQDVTDDMKRSNREIISSLGELNKTIRRSYASQNKSSIMDRNSNQSQSGQGRQRQSQGKGGSRKQRSRGGQRSRGRNNNNNKGNNSSRNQGSRGSMNRGQESGQGGNDSGSDRMRKLRNRFDDSSENNE